MDKQAFDELAAKIADGTASQSEKELYNAWFNTFSDETEWYADELGPLDERKARLFENIQTEIGRKQPRPLWQRIAAAASIVIGLSVGGYFYLHQAPQQQTSNAIAKNDIPPGHNQATLTLANGQKIIITKGLSGQLAIQNNTTINATANNIIYIAKNQTGDQVSYNTLATERGEQSPYPLVLADGTKVWLNAESSITFPTAFNGKERIVKLTGEAYFEVRHNDQQPFKVQTVNQTIEDIGTSFNVNAYANESVSRTTLLEGAVRVNGVLLKPGQQSDGKQIEAVDTDEAVAWKNGNFQFDNADIKTVMRQLVRWYDVAIDYQGNLANIHYTGTVPRRSNISAVLQMLKETGGTDYKIEGKTVTIMK
jgi:ferric-dicitrate binding protein FerR (iron transport regulator)